MEHKSHTSNTNSDREIIKKILSENENDAAMKDKMYRILYEASLADDINIDTNLIDECVKTIDQIEGNEEHLSEEKIKAMRRNIDQRYKDWNNPKRWKISKKWTALIAACIVLIFFTSSMVVCIWL